MSATTPPIRQGSHSGEDAMRLYVDALRQELEPDPTFRRRLRGTVMNRFVADREGAWPELPRHNRMGALGRACLYASLATALSVSGVMAASEAAVPGDLLYPLKLSIEEMRAHVAPAHLHDDLAADALAERIDELGRLVESGDVARATALAAAIGPAYDQLASVGPSAKLRDERLGPHLARLMVLLERIPADARQTIERAMNVVPDLQPDAPEDGRRGPDAGGSSGNRPAGAGQQGSGAETDGPELTPRPERSPKPGPTHRPERTERPAPSPRAEPAPAPHASPKPEPSPKPNGGRESNRSSP
jgi:hypothetical protein